MCYSEHRFRLKTCRNDIVLAETMTKAETLNLTLEHLAVLTIVNVIVKTIACTTVRKGILKK
jgi:hypothetical protein